MNLNWARKKHWHYVISLSGSGMAQIKNFLAMLTHKINYVWLNGCFERDREISLTGVV